MKKILIFIVTLSLSVTLMAQEGLKIEQVFEKYGMKEGSVLVELSTDVLAGNTNISFYKSMVVADNEGVQQTIEQAITDDLKGGSKIMESVKNGSVETGYYHLEPPKSGKTNEYILYKNKSGKITLIYLKGDFGPQDIEKELGKLKDLFIYVNKKRVKLQ